MTPAPPVVGRTRFLWMEAVLASKHLTPAEKVLAIRIAMHLNDVTGRCNPSEETLAKGVGFTPRHVRRLKVKLRNSRWLDHSDNAGGARGGIGISNNYLLLRDNLPLEATRTSTSGLGSGPTRTSPSGLGGGSTRTSTEGNPDRQDREPGSNRPPNTSFNNSNTEKDIYARSDEFGAERRVEQPTHDKAKPPTVIDEATSPRLCELSHAEIEERFQAFWQQCVRATDYGKAKKIYSRVVREGKATPDELLHAMRIYAAAREEAADPRFDKSPATWLQNECWHDDPEAIAPKGGLAAAVRKAISACKREAEAGGTPAPRFADSSLSLQDRPPEDQRWVRIKEKLRPALGAREYIRYFADAAVCWVKGPTVVLSVTAPIDARQIEERYKQTLLNFWQAEAPEIRQVSIVVRMI